MGFLTRTITLLFIWNWTIEGSFAFSPRLYTTHRKTELLFGSDEDVTTGQSFTSPVLKQVYPKLLEYNADTPSLQLESGVLSDEWYKDTADKGRYHQANYMQEAYKHSFMEMKKQC